MKARSNITFSAPIDLEIRKPIWIAISNLYLNTELQDFQHNYIAKTILESPYTIEEVQEIDKFEVFPILKYNLISLNGEWSGFKEDWLVDSIINSLNNHKFYSHYITDISYFFFKRMTQEDWGKISTALLDQKQ